MNIYGIILALLASLALTFATTPDITDYQIDVDVTTLLLRFGLTTVLAYLVVSMLMRLRAKRNEKPTLDGPRERAR